MYPGWSYGYETAPVEAVQSGPVYYGNTAPAVAGLLLVSVGLLIFMKVTGFRAMVAVGRS